MGRDEMDRIDAKQQDEIDSLQKNSRFMFVMLMVGVVASCAQIIECVLVWTRGGCK